MPVFLIDKIQQKNNGEFFLVDAKDIECDDGSSLQAKLDSLEENINNGGGGGGNTPDDEGYDFVAEFENALNSSESTSQ
jgi:hypothetical protein